MQVSAAPGQTLDSTLFRVLAQRKEVFFREHSHLSPEACQEQWNQFITSSGQDPDQLDVLALPARSRPASVQQNAPPPKRQRLADGAPSKVERAHPCGEAVSPNQGNILQDAHEMLIKTGDPPHSKLENWLEDSLPRYHSRQQTEPANPQLLQHRRRLSRSIQVDTYDDPSAYIRATNIASPSTISSSQHSRRPSSQTPISPYATQSSFLSASPLSDSMGHALDSQTIPTSVGMSRTTSKNSSVCRELDNMRLGTSMSRGASGSSYSVHPSSLPPSQPTFAAADSYPPALSLDGRQITSHAGGAAESKKVNEVLKKQQQPLALIDEDDVKMERSISTGSNNSAISRLSKRSQEQTAMGKRTIHPAPGPTLFCNTASLDVNCSLSVSQSMSRTSSSQSQTPPVAIARLPCNREVKEKLHCPECNMKPDGYKGEHELRRHRESKHVAIKTVFVTIDISPNKQFLADCDYCQNFKQYNAYYNAAAHLRRKHFNPKSKDKKRSGKLPEAEKRGGKGGGLSPPMDELKRWMHSFEVDQNGRPLDPENEKYITSVSDTASTNGLKSDMNEDEEVEEEEDEVEERMFVDDIDLGTNNGGFNNLLGGAGLAPPTSTATTTAKPDILPEWAGPTVLPATTTGLQQPYVQQPSLELPTNVSQSNDVEDLFALNSGSLFEHLPYGQNLELDLNFDDVYTQ